MKIKTAVVNDKDYIITKTIDFQGKTYCLLSNFEENKDILVQRLSFDSEGNQFFEKLEDTEEFYAVLAQFNEKTRKKNSEDKFLPIGTVCILKDASKKIMIDGYLISDSNGGDTLYDYGAVVFPSGNSIRLAFNHNQIDKIIHMGCQDEESLVFTQTISSIEPVVRKLFEEQKVTGKQNG